ncbi:hypothetical protein D9758_016458 [Tetrapyrgos nigripes]|uniref:Uncharacterized protein n=1 Tax=Tetrapyrgos nigripes TaxID=182062 RepID=A0A8H5CC20_9AGAR|nr:hypothetical protein D9758_016458 [Tetrapyrgos nigripes]
MELFGNGADESICFYSKSLFGRAIGSSGIVLGQYRGFRWRVWVGVVNGGLWGYEGVHCPDLRIFY